MSQLAHHYQQDRLDREIRHALEHARLHDDRFDPNIIAAFDQFHIGGRQATDALLQLAGFSAGDLILDIGSGIGGPARQIAERSDSRVIGLDLSPDYCQAAQLISRQLGVSPQTCFLQADAISLPFDSASFDGIWTQHVTMNIADKSALFAECARILKPAGKLVMYEVTRNEDANNQILYPLPWSIDGEHSHLVSSSTFRHELEKNELEPSHFNEVTESAINSLAIGLKRLEQKSTDQPNLGLLLGSRYRVMMQNLIDQLQAGRLSVWQILAARA